MPHRSKNANHFWYSQRYLCYCRGYVRFLSYGCNTWNDGTVVMRRSVKIWAGFARQSLPFPCIIFNFQQIGITNVTPWQKDFLYWKGGHLALTFSTGIGRFQDFVRIFVRRPVGLTLANIGTSAIFLLVLIKCRTFVQRCYAITWCYGARNKEGRPASKMV